MEILLVLIGVLFVGVFPLLYYASVGKFKKDKLSSLKEIGKVIEARITGIHNEALLLTDNVVLCRIYAKKVIDNIEYKFISEKLNPKDCKHLKEGDSIRVLINPLNPKEYYFDYEPNDTKY